MSQDSDNDGAARLERLTQLAVESFSDAAFWFDADGRFFYANEAACRSLGYSREELLALSVVDIDPDYREERLSGAQRQALEDGFAVFESVHRRRDGSEYPVEITIRSSEADGRRVYFALARNIAERQRAEEALRLSEERFRGLFEAVPVGLYRSTLDGRLLEVNPALVEILHFPDRESLLAENAALHYVDLGERERWMAELGNEGVLRDVEVRLRCHDGTVIWVRLNIRAVEDRETGEVNYEGAVYDITEEKRTREELRRSEVRFRSLVQNASDMISLIDRHGKVLYESPAHSRVLGYRSAGRVGANVLDLVHPGDHPRVRRSLELLLESPGTSLSVEYRFLHRDGSWRVLESLGTNLLDDPAVGGIVVNSRDVTDRKATEELLRHQALHDALTDLPNRTLFLDRLESAIERFKRHPDRFFAVLFVDLDRFKVVNDSLGHTVGDRLLVEIARLLRSGVKSTDTVARVGGDEFLILLEEMREPEDAVRVAERLHHFLDQPLAVSGHEIFRTASVGIALGQGGEGSSETLLRDADIAMHRAKSRGGACHVVFDRTMHRFAVERLQLETELKRALAEGELTVLYQPIVHLADDTLAGLEALVRWQHPKRGMLAPVDFLEVAEESGMIRTLDELVLRQVGRQVRAWRGAHGVEGDLFVSVNLSQLSLAHTGAVDRLIQLLEDGTVDPGDLAFEITEGSFFENPELIADTLGRLKRLGVALFLDDFGSGYSSLSYLHRFPIDTLKIDRSFVCRPQEEPGHPEIVKAIVALGRNLGLDVIAEGVETREQAQRMHRLGCDLGQGFLYSRPLPAREVEVLLADRSDGPRRSRA